MLVFQFVGYAIGHIIKDSFINAIIQGVLEFSSGSLQLLQFSHTPLVYSLICFNLSFSGLSVMMQTDNLLDGIDYSFKAYFKARLFHGLCSFTLCLLILTYLLWAYHFFNHLIIFNEIIFSFIKKNRPRQIFSV